MGPGTTLLLLFVSCFSLCFLYPCRRKAGKCPSSLLHPGQDKNYSAEDNVWHSAIVKAFLLMIAHIDSDQVTQTVFLLVVLRFRSLSPAEFMTCLGNALSSLPAVP